VRLVLLHLENPIQVQFSVTTKTKTELLSMKLAKKVSGHLDRIAQPHGVVIENWASFEKALEIQVSHLPS
jgi:hypothetical protein